MKRRTRLLLIIFGIGLTLGWLGLSRMDSLLRSKLVDVVNGASGDRYVFTLGELRSKPWEGSVSLHDVKLLPREMHMEGAAFVLSVEADRVSLEGLSYWALLVDGKLRVDAVRVIAPHVEYLYGGSASDSTAHVGAGKKKNPPSGDGTIGEIELRDASGVMRRMGQDSADLSVADLDIVLRGLSLLRSEGGGPKWRLASARVDLHGVRAALPPLYDARLDTVELHFPEGEAHIGGMRLAPRAGRDAYGKLVDESVELLDLDLAQLELRGIDLHALLTERAVLVERITAQGGHLYLDHDGRLPAKPDRPRVLPRTGLANMGVRVSVDSLDIALDEFRYGDRGAKADGYGDIIVEHPHVLAANVRTQSTPIGSDSLAIRVNGALYGEGAIDARFTMAYGAADDAFALSLRLGDMGFVPFKALTKDMLKASPVAGRIQELTMMIGGNTERADVRFAMGYTGLQLEVLPDEGLKGKVISGLANMAVIDANPWKGEERRPRFTLLRRPDRTIAAYIVGGLKEGVIRTLLPPKIAEAAMERTR